MNQQYDEIIGEMMKEIAALREEQRRIAAQKALFSILNINTPSQITANQNDYDPGDYDFLVLSTDASRNISGFTGGVDGRRLYLMNSGSQNIVLLHASALSTLGNRIRCPGAVSYTMTPNGTGTKTRVELIYVITSGVGFWNVMFGSAP